MPSIDILEYTLNPEANLELKISILKKVLLKILRARKLQAIGPRTKVQLQAREIIGVSLSPVLRD